MSDSLDQLVRRVDEDRWLASRFSPKAARARLVAFYALNYEIARTGEAVTQADLGRIRLQWWREAVAEIYAGGPIRTHPALRAYGALAREDELPRAPLDALINAHEQDFETAPFANWDALDAYVDATAGNVLRLAMALCGGAAEPFARAGGLAWGYAGLMRAQTFWRSRGRSFLPSGGALPAMRERAERAYCEAGALARTLPPAAFAAIGYVTLVPLYLRALDRSAASSLWSRQWRLLFASATGGL